MSFYLNVVSVEKIIFSSSILKIQVTGVEGQLGIYSGHSPLLTLIKPGLLLITTKNLQKEYIYLSGGILEVQPTLITILSDIAVLGKNLNYHSIIKKKQITEKKIIEENDPNKKKLDIQNLKKELEKTIAKLKVIEMMNKFKT